MKYTISKKFVERIAKEMGEFAMGGTQVRVILQDGRTFHPVTLSNCMHIIGVEDYKDLPFDVNDIEKIEQSESDERCARKRTLFPNAKEIMERRA